MRRLRTVPAPEGASGRFPASMCGSAVAGVRYAVSRNRGWSMALEPPVLFLLPLLLVATQGGD